MTSRFRLAWALGLVCAGVLNNPLTFAAQEPQGAVGWPPSLPGPMEQRSRPITADNPIPRRIASTTPAFPSEVAGKDLSVQVTLRLTIDEGGSVGEARPVNSSIQVSAQQLRDLVDAPRDENAEEGRRLIDAFTRSAVDAVRQWLYEPPVEAPVTFNVTFRFSPKAETQVVLPAVPAGPAGSAVPAPVKTKHVSPVYPPDLLEFGVEGVVIVELEIGVDGRVGSARVVRADPALVFERAALDAVRQWEFEPVLVNGVHVAVSITATVQFSAR